MAKKLHLLAITIVITFLTSFAEKPIAVFNERTGAMSLDELTHNVIINSQNEKTATNNFNLALSF